MGDVPDEEWRPQEHPSQRRHPSSAGSRYTEGHPSHHAYYLSHYASPSQTSATTHFSPHAFPQGSIPPHPPNFQRYPTAPHLAIHNPYYYPYTQGPHANQYSYSPGGSPTAGTSGQNVYSDQRLAPGPGIVIPPPRVPGPGPALTPQHPYPHMIYSQLPAYQYSASGPMPGPAPVSGPYPYHLAVEPGAEPWYFLGPSCMPSVADFDNRHAYVPTPQYSPQTGTTEHHSGPSAMGPSPQALIVTGPSPDLSPLPRSTAPPSPTSGIQTTLVPRNIETTMRSRQRPPEKHPDRSYTIGRRPYQPNPPPNRSKWVMWVGNIPADGTQEELMRFFTSVTLRSTSPHLDLDPSAEGETRSESGVHSIFLISQSNCAFVNYDSEAKLLHAVSVCNGCPLRPYDPRCLKLVCRIRRPEEDLRAGVGAQRGMGMHTRWVHENQSQEKGAEAGVGTVRSSTKARANPASLTDHPTGEKPPSLQCIVTPQSSEWSPNPQSAELSPIARRGNDECSGSVSFASTTSSFLANHFPQRYFILKSLTQHDLDLSVQRGLWATQPHNEPILDQAYRTSKDVFLIFGANKSGEFFGYARMAGPINASESLLVPRNSRLESSQRVEHDFVKGSETSEMGPSVLDAESSAALYSSTGVPSQEPPQAIDAGDLAARPAYDSATGSTNDAGDHTIPRVSEVASLSIDPRAVPSSPLQHPGDSKVEIAGGGRLTLAQATAQGPTQTTTIWGTPFSVEWIRVQRLPFNRTKHLRNPWNTDREIKVSRDGTELEPEVGQRLLAEWGDPPTTALPPTKGPGGRGGGSGRPSTLIVQSTLFKHSEHIP